MRLWTLHPKYLDSKGLVALWREGLLAQKVLQGKTQGYKNHPQLNRFKVCSNPKAAIAQYLIQVVVEAERRGYNFDSTKISKTRSKHEIPVSNGQVQYETEHLRHKLKIRDPAMYKVLNQANRIKLHPMFKRYEGDVESWEITE